MAEENIRIASLEGKSALESDDYMVVDNPETGTKKLLINDLLDITGTTENIAEDYDPTATYSKGDYCIKNGAMYRCNVNISTPEAWTSIHWDECNAAGEITDISDKVSDLKSALSELEDTQLKIDLSGDFSGTGGVTVNIALPAGTYKLHIDSITTTDTSQTTNLVTFYDTSLIKSIPDIARDVPTDVTFTLTRACTKMYLYASNSGASSSGKSCTYYGVKILSATGLSVRLDGIESNIDNIVANETNEENLIVEYTLNASKTFTNVLDRGLYRLETNIVGNETNQRISVEFRVPNGSVDIYRYFIKKNEPSKYIFLPTKMNWVYISCSPTYENDTIKIYRVNTGKSIASTLQSVQVGSGSIDVGIPENGTWGNGGKQYNLKRLAYGLFKYSGLFTVSLSDYSTYKFSVVTYKSDGTTSVWDTDWRTNNFTFYGDNTSVFGITVTRTDNADITVSETSAIGLSVVSEIFIDKTDSLLGSEVRAIKDIISTVKPSDISNNKSMSQIALFAGRFKPCYDHLFVGRTGASVVVPHESLYHVRLSRRLGFNCIEANVAPTSDGVYVVNHLNAGKFGGYFHHVDGVTDISDISLDSVTWGWVVQNVRYNSTIEKYRTRPCRLEEFLGECRQQNIIPFLGGAGTAGITEIADKIMGKDNYIAYNGNRINSPSAFIYSWVSNLTSAEAILNYCNGVGKPFIYGLGNPGSFTDEGLEEVVNLLHENGYYIGTSYSDTNWYKYAKMGFDFNGTQTLINRIDIGNLYNMDTLFGFSSFDATNAAEANGVLTFSSSGTIKPDIQDTTYEVCGIDLEVWFDGTITLSAIGEVASQTYTSDGSYPVFIATVILNGSPKFTLTCNEGTIIKDIKYKASAF